MLTKIQVIQLKILTYQNLFYKFFNFIKIAPAPPSFILASEIEKILDEISFTATDRAGEKIIINKDYINKNLDTLVKDTDLSKFILQFF